MALRDGGELEKSRYLCHGNGRSVVHSAPVNILQFNNPAISSRFNRRASETFGGAERGGRRKGGRARGISFRSTHDDKLSRPALSR